MHTLIGSPPGYVGYEEKGLLEKGLESSKFKVILFDEIEKAHSKLFDLVLEMLEEGEILMSNGNRVDVSECIRLFTSNLGQEEANKALNKAGFVSMTETGALREQTLKTEFNKIIKDKLKPEFLARLNGIFYFKPLSTELLEKISAITLKECLSLVKNKNIKITYSQDINKKIIQTVRLKEKNLHARHIKNFIDLEIMTSLGDKIMDLTKDQTQDKVEIELNIDDDGKVLLI
jgi:ATP-dependent Clp protease ATP-binding subunit ClpC